MPNSTLEYLLEHQIRALELPEPEREAMLIPGRKFRTDFSWPAPIKLAVEVNGGTWVKSGHTSHAGISRDYLKNNLLMLAGWRVLMFDGEMIESGEAVDLIAKCLGGVE